MEQYRSGHNGADSKSVCVQAHVGSNPTPSALYKVRKYYVFGLFFVSENIVGLKRFWLEHRD